MTITDKENFRYERAWRKYLFGYRGPLPKGIRKPTLLICCFAMAEGGRNGIDCYKSDATIAEEIGVYHRQDIAKYRKAAVELGWFRQTRIENRVWHMDINIPEVGPMTGPTTDGRGWPYDSTVVGPVTGPTVGPMTGPLPSRSIDQVSKNEGDGCTEADCWYFGDPDHWHDANDSIHWKDK